MSARYARLAEIAKTLHTTTEQAAALGVSLCALKFIRHRAKAAGYDVGTVERKRDRAPRLSALDVAMSGPPCPRDGLRGDHECVSAERMAQFRSAEYADLRVHS